VNFDAKKTLFLIDGSSFLYRAYYGLKPLHTATGEPVQAVFSFCRMIKRLIDVYKPQNVALVWDSKGKTTRHEMFPNYKSTRQAPPSDIFEQKKHIVEFATLIGMQQIEQLGVEADDIMYSLAKEWLGNSGKNSEENGEKSSKAVVFVTLDKDMGQALTLGEHVYLLDAFKEQCFDREAIENKMGFSVEKMPFYFALLGDASDNIPGVKGIGKKTGVDLVNQFDSLEDMYAQLHEIKKAGVKTALMTYKDDAFLSYTLFLLQYHASNLSHEQLIFNEHNWRNARPLFVKLGFKSLLAELDQTKQERAQGFQEKLEYWQKYHFVTVTTHEQLQDLCAHLKEKGTFALDTETTGLQALEVELIGVSICADEESAYYIPCGHKTGEQQLERDVVLAALKPILENALYKKYLHNAKYDQLVLANHGIELVGVAMDTLVAASLILKDWQSASLKKLSQYFFNEDMLTYDEIVKVPQYHDFSYVPIHAAALYSCADSYQTYRLVEIIKKEFVQNSKISDLYYVIEHPLIQVLYDMEKRGVYIDVDFLHNLGVKVTQEVDDIKQEINAVVGHEKINLNSPRQIENLLFNVLQLVPQKKSKTGKFSTDQEVLKALALDHIIPALIIKHRELMKLKTTYIDVLPHYVNKKTNKIHTTFSQTVTATGRLASSNPNLQNIPTDASGYGIEVRAAFQADPGHVFVSADYSQIELRVLAHLSQDTALLHAFLTERDIHKETSARLFDISFDEVTNEQRQLGKRINFSILYGLTPYGLSKDLGLSFKDSKRYIERYFEQYPRVSAWMESVIEFTKENGYVETLFGRRRYIPGIYEKNHTMYQEACRVAINTVAQGTAAEIVKLGMLECKKRLDEQCPQASILLQIHDELIVTVPAEYSQQVEKIVKNALESVVQWSTPLTVVTHSGVDWKSVTK